MIAGRRLVPDSMTLKTFNGRNAPLSRYWRGMLCYAYAVGPSHGISLSDTVHTRRSLSVRPSVRRTRSCILSKRINISSNFFHRWVATSHVILVFPYQTWWQYSDRDPTICRWVGKNRDTRPMFGFIAVVNVATALNVIHTAASSDRGKFLTVIAGKRVVCCSRETDDEAFMTRSLNVTPKTTEQTLTVRSG